MDALAALERRGAFTERGYRNDVETQLADHTADYTPSQLLDWGTRLVDLLDQDGAEPDDTPPAVATAIDAHARPRCAEDGERSTPARQAEALADLCGFVLDHGDLPQTAGRRPNLNVVIRLEDLENRARAACLDFGGTLSPESLRMLCCDAAVIPVVLDGNGVPLDVGRSTRVIPDGIRRAVTVRDGGCARCGKRRGAIFTIFGSGRTVARQRSTTA